MNLEDIRGIDIYLLDQLLKENIHNEQRILDAGCGSGRNVIQLIKENVDVTCIDPNDERLQLLRDLFPTKQDRFICSSLEEFSSPDPFDAIICNAILHFAQSHAHFDTLFHSLIDNLRSNGVLFIRMTSDIGLTGAEHIENGVFLLPDESYRYLITREKIVALQEQYNLHLLDPVKTSNVHDLRCMTTLVFRKE